MQSLIAVTGAECFIGSHVVGALVQVGARVRARVLPLAQDTAAFFALGRAGAQMMGRAAQIQQEKERLRPSDTQVRPLVCNNQKLRRLTGWQPHLTLHDALARTVDWFSRPHDLERYKTELDNV